MKCRDEILDCARELLGRTGAMEFTIQDIIDCMSRRGASYKESTIRTHVTSLKCESHSDTFSSLEHSLAFFHRSGFTLLSRISMKDNNWFSRSLKMRLGSKPYHL